MSKTKKAILYNLITNVTESIRLIGKLTEGNNNISDEICNIYDALIRMQIEIGEHN